MSAIATFDPVNITTVKDTYSWDEGTPLVELDLADLTINDPSSILSSTNSAGVEYLGYSPFALVTLSSVVTPNPSAIATKVIVDFGDYYNSESNIIMTDVLSAQYFCHVYIMPGIYTVKMTVVEYVKLANVTTNLPFDSSKVYFQPTDAFKELPIFWQWCNYQCTTPLAKLNLRSKNVPWTKAKFQETNGFTWQESGSPCVKIPTQTTLWNWDGQMCSSAGSTTSTPLSWSTVECESCLSRTWDDIEALDLKPNCVEDPYVVVPITTEFTIEQLVRVVEIPPKAFLEVQQDPSYNNRISPYSVRLSPKYVRCGSFPIEKVEWNLGDGSPILTQRRWSVNTDPIFQDNLEYEVDWKDPRNFDIVHTYIRTPDSGSSFYPSLTCYASSTHTTDCVAGLVGPLKLRSSTSTSADSKVTILQNELTDHGRILIGEVDGTFAVWRYDK
jgi:hypothetical protein